ncbi:AI-2E family transporter [Psychrobacillus vulpis]|uniref:AI-2E family transporter n=1 Tax=Psychrobacillus vulpis TaxID=2325572 RepID=A0A544TQT8_9BACI|nr:AI-2E family transporter [Psychrobacillus vulpis]TQR19811.1 AI-2E family transporter [Psychrobacillus vulpis]
MIAFQINKKEVLTQWIPITIIILLSFIAYPLALAILCGYFLYPITNFFYKKFKLPITLSVLLTEAVILSGVLLLLFFLVQTLIDIIPLIHAHLVKLPVAEIQRHPIFLMFEGKFQTLLNKFMNDLLVYLTHLPSYFFELLLFSMGLFFSLHESLKDRLWFLVYFPKQTRPLCQKAFNKVSGVLNKFISVELKLFFLTLFLLSAGFFVLGMEQPIKYAFLISLVDSVPFLGTGLVMIPLSIYFFLVDQHTVGIIVFLLYIFVQLTRHIVESVLWSSSMQIKAVHVFFLSATAILIFGFIGILFSPFIYLFANKWSDFTKTS